VENVDADAYHQRMMRTLKNID